MDGLPQTFVEIRLFVLFRRKIKGHARQKFSEYPPGWVFGWVFGKPTKKMRPKNGHKKTPGAIETTSLGAHGADSQIRTGDLILTNYFLTRFRYRLVSSRFV